MLETKTQTAWSCVAHSGKESSPMIHRSSNRSRSSSLTALVGLLSFAGLMTTPALSQAQVVAGDSASVQVLLDGGVLNPTTVAIRDNVAFLVEGQLSLIGQVPNPFQ